jgi:hypothetical protein
MELGPSWGATSRSVTQESSNILWSPKIYYLVHESLQHARLIQRIRPSPKHLVIFHNNFTFDSDEFKPHAKPFNWRTTHLRLSVTAYSIFFAATRHTWKRLLPTSTRGLAMLWWKGAHLNLCTFIVAPFIATNHTSHTFLTVPNSKVKISP